MRAGCLNVAGKFAGRVCAARFSPSSVVPSYVHSVRSNGVATSSVAAHAQQQGQSFSQLKVGEDQGKEQTEMVFDPQQQGAADLEKVANTSGPEESLARVFFHRDSEAAINEQINHELTMSYNYDAVSSYFNRDNVALPGFRDFFRAASDEERVHAQQLKDYQATRGGRVKLGTITAPEMDYSNSDKGDALHAFEFALAMERLNLQYLYNLHEVADKNGDGQMADFVEVMLEEQVHGVKECADYVAKLRRVGKGLGVYQIDDELAKKVGSAKEEAPAAGQ